MKHNQLITLETELRDRDKLIIKHINNYIKNLQDDLLACLESIESDYVHNDETITDPSLNWMIDRDTWNNSVKTYFKGSRHDLFGKIGEFFGHDGDNEFNSEYDLSNSLDETLEKYPHLTDPDNEDKTTAYDQLKTLTYSGNMMSDYDKEELKKLIDYHFNLNVSIN
jgi:hypothetical protein